MILVLVVDSLLIGGLKFVLDKVASAVDAELDDESNLKEELLATQLRYELGELDDEEFARREKDLLARLREVREREGTGGTISISTGEGGAARTGVEISLDASLTDEEER